MTQHLSCVNFLFPLIGVGDRDIIQPEVMVGFFCVERKTENGVRKRGQAAKLDGAGSGIRKSLLRSQ